MIRRFLSTAAAAQKTQASPATSILTRVQKDLKESMISKNTIKSQALKSMLADMKYAQKSSNRPAESEQALYAVIQKMIVKREDSIKQFESAGRSDLVEKEAQELGFIRAYLPQQMPEEEVKKVVMKIISDVGASSPRDLGKVIKAAKDVLDPVVAPPAPVAPPVVAQPIAAPPPVVAPG